MMIDILFENFVSTLEKVKNTQTDKISRAAEIVANVIENDGIIYIFGCGHSHLVALDSFYRAGGLANVSAILDTDLMLHNGAAKSSKMEKMSGIAESVFERYCITEKDVLFVISTSGKNAVPVEMAKTAKAHGVKTISVVSSAYFDDKSVNEKLYECSDIYIDNCVCHGDALISIPDCEVKMGSVSTCVSTFAVQSVLIEGAARAKKSGVDIPIYMSGNVKNGAEYNSRLIKKYLPRIKHL